MDNKVEIVAQQLGAFLRKGERVLILVESRPDGHRDIFRQAVEKSGGVPVIWGADRRWLDLLRTAFTHKVGTVVGPPVLILGLAKLARAKETPLYIHNVVTTDYPCRDWMAEGIVNGLDCTIRNCAIPGVENGWSEEPPDGDLLRASREIIEWSSVLDCRIQRCEGGLDVEVVYFPGEKLPRLPACAKRVVRPWNPERDVPLMFHGRNVLQ